jgi:16S rRNA (adenine1518-N6/adenine1519-N6)-dimethyltransferase
MKEENFSEVPNPSKDQHFMTNGTTVEKIVEAAGINAKDVVLEIGAGSGILTERLAAKHAKVIAVEIDRRFSKTLGRLGSKNLEILYANALDVIDEIAFNKMVANIPYSICEPLLGKLYSRQFDLAVLSVPENFYRILSSVRGEKTYSILSLRSEVFFKIDMKFRIPAEDFDPVPRTGSVAIVITPLGRNELMESPDKFVLREVMLQRKKKLKNALMEALINLNKNTGLGLTKKSALAVIAKMHIGAALLDKKTETMNLNDFLELRSRLKSFS